MTSALNLPAARKGNGSAILQDPAAPWVHLYALCLERESTSKPILTMEGGKKCLISNNLIFLNTRSLPKMPVEVGLYSLLLILMALTHKSERMYF